MSACCAYGCRNRFSNKTKGVTFHRFPENPVQRRAWMLAVRRENWKPSKNTRICSEHFSEDQIDRTSYLRVRLRENAVPNVFCFSSSVKTEKKDTKETEKKGSEVDKSTSNFCSEAARPSRTAPLVISVKPIKNEPPDHEEPSVPIISDASVCETASAVRTVTCVSSDPLMTTLPLGIFTSQILTAAGTPIITSPLPSILTTTVGPFITTGLPQTLALPQNLASAQVMPLNPNHPVSDNSANVMNGTRNLVIQSVGTIPFEDEGEIVKLRNKNLEYVKKIKTLQQKIRRQKRTIARLKFNIQNFKNNRFLDETDFVPEVSISELSEEEIADDPLEEVSEPEVRADSPEEILPC